MTYNLILFSQNMRCFSHKVVRRIRVSKLQLDVIRIINKALISNIPAIMRFERRKHENL